MNTVTLNNGVEMPVIGFGVFQVPDPQVCEESVVNAIQAGCRLIDTAAVYGNEAAVGRAIRRCGVAREDLFITTKLWVQDAGYEKAKAAFEASMERLGLEYLDLYLIHRPMGDYYGSWRAMEELYKAGRIRALGLSNFESARVMDLMCANEIPPAVNQIECHPFYQQEAALEFLNREGIRMEGWAPFAEGKQNLFTHPVLTEIGAKYGKTAAQVTLRWNLQRGVIPLPKSVHRERVEANLDIFDFVLSREDMERIRTLDGGSTFFGNNMNPEYVRAIHQVKIH